MKEEYFADDRHIVSDFINKMTDAELDAFIAKKEAEIKAEKLRKATLTA